MARVLVARQPWGILWEKNATTRVLSIPLSGTSASINTTVYSAATGTGTVASFVTDTNGELPGWVDEGTHTLTVNSVATQVEAVSGATDARIDLVQEAPLNLKDSRFAAVGDGVANDTAAIQAWYDHAATATRSELFAPPGLYLTDGNLMPSTKCAMKGAGAGSTVFKLRNNAPVLGGMPHAHRAILSHKNGTVGFADLTIEAIELDGNVAANSADEFYFGIETWGGNRLTIRDVYAHDFRGDGILLSAATTSSIETVDALVENIRLRNTGKIVGGVGGTRMGVAAIYTRRLTVRCVKAIDCAGYAVDLEADNTTQAHRDALVEDIQCEDTFAGVGIFAITGATCSNNTVRDVTMRSGPSGRLLRGVVLENTTGSTVDGVRSDVSLGQAYVVLSLTNTGYRVRNTPGEYCLLSMTTAQANILSTTPTVLEWTSEREDPDGMHDQTNATTRKRVTAIVPGLYVPTVNLRWLSTAGTYRQVSVRRNGTDTFGLDRRPAAQAFQSHSFRPVRMVPGDYIEVVAEHDVGASTDLVLDANYSPEFSLVKVA